MLRSTSRFSRADEDQSADRGGYADGREGWRPSALFRGNFDESRLTRSPRRFVAAPKDGRGYDRGLDLEGRQRRYEEHQWLGFQSQTEKYGTNYLQRAMMTGIGLGANGPQDAIYPTSTRRARARSIRARKICRALRKGAMPPVEGFWSLTMYDGDYFFVRKPAHRYSISQRNKLKANADGSVDFYLQDESPGRKRRLNWLPAPKEEFVLMMRLYWPKETKPSIIDGSWKIPPVQRSSLTKGSARRAAHGRHRRTSSASSRAHSCSRVASKAWSAWARRSWRWACSAR